MFTGNCGFNGNVWKGVTVYAMIRAKLVTYKVPGNFWNCISLKVKTLRRLCHAEKATSLDLGLHLM